MSNFVMFLDLFHLAAWDLEGTPWTHKIAMLHRYKFDTTRFIHGDTDSTPILVCSSVFRSVRGVSNVCLTPTRHCINFGVSVLLCKIVNKASNIMLQHLPFCGKVSNSQAMFPSNIICSSILSKH